nr:c-type cytochrome [Chelatococcus sp. SYSU_G07232]
MRLPCASLPFLAAGLALGLAGAAAQDLRGHGGPVRAIAVAPDGRAAMTGSFDQSAILWRLDTGAALAVLRVHDGAVNAVAALGEGVFATGGEDSRIAIWRGTAATPERVLTGHGGPVAALAVSPDGRLLASAAWDGTVRLWPLDGGPGRVLEGHRGNVNGVAVTRDGTVVSAGYDATLRIWSRDGTPVVATLPAPLNAVLVAPDGEILAAGADGQLHILSAGGQPLAEAPVGQAPAVALALSPDGATVAASGLHGDVALVDRKARRVRTVLAGGSLPVWSLAFSPDGRELLAGGADRVVRRWNAASGARLGTTASTLGEDPLAAFAGDRGAELFRACAACHTLTPDGGNRAGPSLYGLFGRRIAGLPGYAYSEGLKKLDIVWTHETVARLFEIGPSLYTPGTKMPEQKVTDPKDREALVTFLEKATAPR